MPKASKNAIIPTTNGPATEWRDELDGYTLSFVTVTADTDLTPLLQGLPNDQCSSPHWGYIFKGRLWFRSDDREEAFGPGDAFYAAPGHTSGADGGSEFVVFSPSEIMAEIEAHMMQRAQALYG